MLRLIPLALLLADVAAAQGTISGRVQSANHNPLSNIEVKVLGSQLPVQSNADGIYRLTNVPPGQVVIEVSGGGYVPQQRSITVSNGISLQEDFELAYLSTSVNVVESLREYHLQETSLATRTYDRIIDLPLSVQVYPNQLIEDRAILEGNDLFRNVSGINQSTYSAMAFRGFTQREILYNGSRGNPFGSLDGDVNNSGFSTSQIRLTNIQRVEVLKGPVSAVYGSAEAGGLVNYVTKQPKETLDGEVQVRFGSYNQKFANGDFSGPFGEHFLLRGAFYFEDRDTFRNNSSAENEHGAAGLIYKINERHRFSIEAEYINQFLGGQRLRGVPVNAAGRFLTDIQWSANEPSDRIKMIGRVLQFRGDHDFQSGWKLNYIFRYLKYENSDKYHEPRGLNPSTLTGQTMRREYRNYFRSNDDWALNLTASRSAKTGPLQHTFVAGFEQFNQDFLFSAAQAFNVPPIDLFRPAYGVADPRNYILSAPIISTATPKRSGYYGQDEIHVNRYLRILLSGRADHYDDKGFALVPLRYSKTALAGRAGLLFKPVERVSLYAHYANSFTRAPVFAQAPSANGPFPPETGREFEAGAKAEVLERKLFLSTAFFNINKKNILRTDPNLGPRGNDPNALLAVGRARSRGVEVNVDGFLTKRWYVTANYAYVNTLILTDNVPSIVGQPLANTPRNTLGLFSRFNLLKRTGIGFGMESVSQRIEPFAGIRASGYTIADVAVYQDLNAWARIQLQVTNVANSTYALASLFAARVGNIPGQPRAFIGTLTVNPFRR